MGLYPLPYQPGPMEPIVSPGQNVLFQQPTGYDLYEVIFQEPIPASAPLTVNLATNGLAAGANTGVTPVSLANQEDMNYGELAQFRFHVLDPVSVALFQNQGSARNVTQLVQGLFTMRSRFLDPHAAYTEHYVYQQYPAFMQATNFMPYTVAQARVSIWGFRNVLRGANPQGTISRVLNQEPLAHFVTLDDAIASGKKFTVIPIAGWH